MQRGLGGFPHERLHQDGKRQEGKDIRSFIAQPLGFRRWGNSCRIF
ncbi:MULTISPECIES: hypothetical protein [unclassified Moorena]|nr:MULTISPECIES: hypothetical protein [unclassified Moorena]NEO19565.1 hypothetical protein [Moorena sp. SIO4A5]NEQ60188.1 hypothetical protein [Moorena sp. SIO4A1]